MLDKEVFKAVYGGLLTAKGVTVDEQGMRFTYEAMKNDFENEEFENIALDVFKNEKFYGKIPDPALFYERKKRNAPVLPSKFQEAKLNFLAKCQDYLNSDYIPDAEKREFNRSLTSNESAALKYLGGISAVWAAVHKGGVWDGEAVAWKMKELGKAFDDVYREAESGDLLRLENCGNDNGQRLIDFDLEKFIKMKRIPA